MILIGWTLETKEWVCLVWISAGCYLSQTNEHVNTPPEFPVLRGLHIGIGVFFLFKCSRKQGFSNLADSQFCLQDSIKMEIFGTPPPRCKCGHGWSGQGSVFFTSIR